MEKYIISTSADAAIFEMKHGRIEMYRSRHEANNNVQHYWERVFKVTIEEV